MYLIIDTRTVGMQWCRSVSLAELSPLLEHPLELGAKFFFLVTSLAASLVVVHPFDRVRSDDNVHRHLSGRRGLPE